MSVIVVAGVIANKYRNGGAVWTRLSWALGLRKLGCRVYFVEQIGRDACVDEAGQPAPFGACANLAYFQRIVDQFGLTDSAALIYDGGRQTWGLPLGDLE